MTATATECSVSKSISCKDKHADEVQAVEESMSNLRRLVSDLVSRSVLEKASGHEVRPMWDLSIPTSCGGSQPWQPRTAYQFT